MKAVFACTRIACALTLLVSTTSGSSAPQKDSWDPLATARARTGQIVNKEAVIPVQCYTKTDGVANPCWTCHSDTQGHNAMGDWELQLSYAFSQEGLTNHWGNLFADRSREIESITDAQALAYIRADNYSALRAHLAARADYAGWRPDLDFKKGFDEQGFARDGSWWRAVRYKPFLGTFWPTNGSTDDVFIRLPWAFYTDGSGKPSIEVYKINLAILETAMAVPDTVNRESIRREVEPVDETLAGADLDGDGQIAGRVTSMRGLPERFVGKAEVIPVRRFLYPAGTEFLHTVRYVDPDAPSLLSVRMKEVRYSVKQVSLSEPAIALAYREEKDHKQRGLLPRFNVVPDAGLINGFGWRLQGFIEAADGQLRLQTQEEHYYCMGCHGTLGVTVDQTFGFPRKVPGSAGWGHQTLKGMRDVPQAGHSEPEVLTYFKRVRGGDEFRENDEILSRFFPAGVLDERRVKRAGPKGDRDLAWLLAPSRSRALALNKAYMALVREQSFERGRDTLLKPARNVHRAIVNGDTGFDPDRGVYRDGRLWLDWGN